MPMRRERSTIGLAMGALQSPNGVAASTQSTAHPRERSKRLRRRLRRALIAAAGLVSSPAIGGG